MRLIQQLKVWVKRLRQSVGRTQPVAAAPLEAPWTENDALNWKRILESPIGRKFASRARAVHYGMACNQKVSKKTAFGFGECYNWMLSLAQVKAVPTPKEADAAAPQTKEEEYAALLERLTS